jgi:7-keto-8-aminopelargonate synthetase-like enzyme
MLTTLCAEGVAVISTPLSTLPVADACSLVGAEFIECETVENLRVVLDKNPLSKRVIIMLESVSSLTGEAVDISAWLSTAAATGAWVIVDESAALGLGGLRGAGSAELAPASPALLARIVGFQYALGIDVAAIVGPIELRELLMKRSRYLKHEPPPAPIFARLAHVSIDVIELALLQREMLAARSLLVDRAIRSQAWMVAGASPSPILSIRLDSLRKAREVQEGMLQRGLLVEALPARSLRRNGAVVRALISNAHSQEEVEALLTGFAEVRKRLESPVS